MKIQNNNIIVLILTIILCIFITMPSFAANSTDSVLDYEHKGTLTIDYKENIDGSDPISGAEFTIYKIATLRYMGNYRSIVPGLANLNSETDPDSIIDTVKTAYQNGTVAEGYTAKSVTATNGQTSFTNLEHGLYLLEESSPAVEHFASIPVLVALPTTENGTKWIYETTLEPKPLPCGDLIIQKTVSGDAGEKDRAFHFNVIFTGYDQPLHYVKSDNTSGTVRSGDTITLKHGQKVVIDTIPVGTKYTVTEQEANTEGYDTTVDNGTGNVRRTVQSIASFNNAKRNSVDTGDTNIVLVCAIICFIAGITSALLIDKLKKLENK